MTNLLCVSAWARIGLERPNGAIAVVMTNDGILLARRFLLCIAELRRLANLLQLMCPARRRWNRNVIREHFRRSICKDSLDRLAMAISVIR